MRRGIVFLAFPAVLLTASPVLALLQDREAPAPPPASLQSSSRLVEDPGQHDSWTYRSPTLDLRKYNKFIVQNTQVGSDPNAKWGSVTLEERQKFANYLTTAVRTELQKHYQVVTAPGPDVAVIRLTLLGVEPTKSGLATASRVLPFGLAVNSVKSIAGKKGSFSGSVQAAVELFDSQSNQLQFAAVRRKSPNALDIGAATSTEETVKSTADDMAEAIRKGIDKAHGRQD